jgi:serine/threonine-protein kinase
MAVEGGHLPDTSSTAHAPPSSDAASTVDEPGKRVAGLVVGGVGVVGLGLGTVFGLKALSLKSQQQSDCGSATSCTNSGYALAVGDHSTALTDSTISTVGFIAGGVLLAGGAWPFLTSRHASQAPAAILVVPSVAPNHAEMLTDQGGVLSDEARPRSARRVAAARDRLREPDWNLRCAETQ